MARETKLLRITGRVIDRKTNSGIAGLKVEAWDKDSLVKEPIASAVTDQQGSFAIEFKKGHLKDLFGDRSALLFFKVFRETSLIASTQDSAIWSVESPEREIIIQVEPSEGPTDTPKTQKPLKIKGQIRREDGSPIGEGIVRAFITTPTGESLLGEAKTDSTGNYLITSAADPQPADARIQVRVFDREGAMLGTSSLTMRGRSITMDIITQTGTPDEPSVVHGQIRQANLKPLESGTVRIFGVVPAPETLLGEQAITKDDEGRYRIEYQPGRFSPNAGDSTRVVVRVFDNQNRLLLPSSPLFRANPDELVDITLSGNSPPTIDPGTENIDPRAHRRLLRFLNEARIPEDLMVAPHDRKFVDEEEAHTDHIEHHPQERQILDRDEAKLILDGRNQRHPAQGFLHVRDVIDLSRRIAELLDIFLTSFGAANYGRWDLLYPLNPGGTPFAIEHAALMRTYKVIFLADGTDTAVWDPSNETTPIMSRLSGATTGLTSNLVCCGHSFLSDGQLLAVGGGGLSPGTLTSIQGWKFDPVTEKWNKTVGDMSTQRWYPTAMTLGDESGPTGKSGRVLIAAGGSGGPVMEIYNEATDNFSPVTVSGPITHSFPQTYPSLHLLPGGEVFYVPTGFGNCGTGSVYSLSDPSAYFTFSGALDGSWTNVGAGMNRTKGMSALLLQPTYPFVRVIVVGGGDTGTSPTAQVINLSTLSPSWGAPISIPDGRSRVNVNTVLLPDGNVLVLGGLQSSPQTCYRYNPSTPVSAWAEMDELNAPRHYHSCALLLPSGKVMAAGGAASGGCTVSVENTIEVFNPPYLFNPDGTPASRPSILTIDGVAPTTTVVPTVHHGSTFAIGTPEAADIAKVVLVRPMAITHNTDSEQRVIQCSFAKTGATTLSAVAPDGIHPHAMAPRGYYMLFILNAKGVPSEGKFIHLH